MGKSLTYKILPQEQLRSKRLASFVSSLSGVKCNTLINTMHILKFYIFLIEKIFYCYTLYLYDVAVKSSHKKATISTLSEGLNKAVAVLGKVVLFIRHDNVAPL